MPITRGKALKEFFSVPGHSVTTKELMELIKADKGAYISLSDAAAVALGETITEKP